MNLADCINISDLRRLAKIRLPKMVFDYIDGGADDEVTLRGNVNRFRDYQMTWNALVDVSRIDTSTTILGSETRLPFVISPTAATRLFHPRQGERAVARAARDAGMIYSISTLGSVSIEEIADINPGPKWFQVYVWHDKQLVSDILERVRAAGFTGLILTVDMPVAGNRERDPRNDFEIPPRVTLRNAMQALARPAYLLDLATTPRIGPANFPDPGSQGGLMGFVNSQFDRSVTWDYAAWLKQTWGGPFAVKGISKPEDARRVIEIGGDCVWVSNHGGRQLDTAPPTIDTLPAIVDAVAGRAEIVFDGGIRRGGDIVKALALGANGVAIGRAYLYGVAAGGEAGVAKAIDILRSELERTMALLGAPDIDAVSRVSVQTPGRAPLG